MGRTVARNRRPCRAAQKKTISRRSLQRRAFANYEFTIPNCPRESANFHVNQTATFSTIVNYPTRSRWCTVDDASLISEELAAEVGN